MNVTSSALPVAQHRIAVVGGGSKKGQEYLKVLSERKDVKLVATVFNRHVPASATPICGRVIRDGDVETLLKEEKFDIAVVSLPHFAHHRVTELLLRAGKQVIKEKPIALHMAEAEGYQRMVASTESLMPLTTTVQRSFDPVFHRAKECLPKLGAIQSFSYRYTFSLDQMTSGWRADPEKSGGGVIMDMGYHIIDIVQFFFGRPDRVDCKIGYAFPEMRDRRLEDNAVLTLSYPDFQGEILLDRHAGEKAEEWTIRGSSGQLVITPRGFRCRAGDETVDFDAPYGKLELIAAMFDQILGKDKTRLEGNFFRNLDTIRLIDGVYSGK